jgi:hypothetical protein
MDCPWRGWLLGVLLALMRWLARNDIWSLAIVPVEHCIGGSMAVVKEGGKPFVFNVVAKNAEDRVLSTPADLVVKQGAAVLTPAADGTFSVSSGGDIVATASGLTATEPVIFQMDDVLAALFIVAADGTLTPVETPVGQ